MWGLFIIYLFATGASEAPYDCDESTPCIPDEHVFSFPGTQDELDLVCKLEIDFLECTIRREESCHFDPEILPLNYEYLELTREICDKDGALYADIVASIECVKPIFDNDFSECDSHLDDEAMKEHATSLIREGIPAFTENEEDTMDCVKGLYNFACAARKIEKGCGKDAMRAYIKIIYGKANSSPSECSSEIGQHLLDIVRVLKVEEEKEEIESSLEK